MSKMTRGVPATILQYLLWFAASAGGFYLMLRARTTVLVVASRIASGNVGRSAVRIVDQWGIIMIAIGLIICIALIERFLQHASSTGNMVNRFVVVLGIELLTLALADTITQVTIWTEIRRPLGMISVTVELILGGLFVTSGTWWPKVFRRRSE